MKVEFLRHGSHKAHGGKGCQSHGHEVRGDTELVVVENFLCNIKDLLLQLRFGSYGILHAHHRFGEFALVHLTVGEIGELLQTTIYLRPHIFGKFRFLNEFTELVFVYLLTVFLLVIKHQMLRSCHFPHLCHYFLHARHILGLCLYLTEFHAETAQFDLVVDTSEALQHLFGVPFTKVACVVNARGVAQDIRRSVFNEVEERRVLHVEEHRICLFGEFEVAIAHLRTHEAQFSCHALRHDIASGVEYHGKAVRHRSADRYVAVHPAALQFVYADKVGTLRRSVSVEQLYVTADKSNHFFSRQSHIAHRQLVVV